MRPEPCVAENASMLYLAGVAARGSLHGFSAPGIEPDGGSRACAVAVGAGKQAYDAIVVDVPHTLFCGSDADARLQNVDWLRPRAERHEAIIREARDRTSVLPVGFGSIFSGVPALEAVLAQRADAIDDFLQQTAGCDEWSLRAYVSRRDAIARARAALEADAESAAGSGAAYLRARRLDGEAERFAESRALAHVELLVEDLGDVIRDATERDVIEVEDDSDRWLIAHVALLIDRRQRAAFDERLDELAMHLGQQGLSIELTGPWSPYSFCPLLSASPET